MAFASRESNCSRTISAIFNLISLLVTISLTVLT